MEAIMAGVLVVAVFVGPFIARLVFDPFHCAIFRNQGPRVGLTSRSSRSSCNEGVQGTLYKHAARGLRFHSNICAYAGLGRDPNADAPVKSCLSATLSAGYLS